MQDQPYVFAPAGSDPNGDSLAFAQLLLQVRDALAHTPPGTSITIRARRAGDRALLEVADDGPGIAPEHLERIFDRFYRVDGTRASGSGLGLAIARELALRMGGSVTVETRPGRTVFVLQVPVNVDYRGERVKEAGPGAPVEILGAVPEDEFVGQIVGAATGAA